MKLLASTKNKITKGEKVPPLEITEVVLLHCNLLNYSFQQNPRVLSTFIPNKSFVQLLEILPKNVVFSKSFNSTFSCNEV